MKKIFLKISAMGCASCVAHIENDLKKKPGVKDARVNFALEQAEIEYDESKISREEILNTIKKTGYGAMPLNEQGHQNHSHHAAAESELNVKKRLKNLLLAGALSVLILLLSFAVKMGNGGFIMAILAVGVLYAGREFFKIGLPSLIRARPDMDTLVALGISAAFIYSCYAVLFSQGKGEYFMDVGIISTFILLGRYLEARAKGKASEAVRKLLELSAKAAHLKMPDGAIKDVAADQIREGDILLVKPGEKIPADGVIIEGSAVIDESMITGESIPVDKSANDKVIGATLNGSQSFVMKAEKIGSQTVLANIVKMVQEAQMSKAPIQKLVDKVSQYFVWAVIIISILTFVLWLSLSGDFTRALVYAVSVLIIACPCALGLATPISIVVGSGRGASSGILIKNSQALEEIHKITAIAFDKTGTITKGHPEVREWIPLKDEEPETLAAALSLETHSEHPLAKSIIDWFSKEHKTLKPIDLKEIKAVSGKGVEGKYKNSIYGVGSIKFLEQNGIIFSEKEKKQIKEYAKKGQTIIGFGKDKKFLGFFAVSDAIKETSKQAIEKLRGRKIKTIMLTGDNQSVAGEIAKQAGVDQVKAELMPEDKVKAIKELQNKGEFVAMVGDGINDSPSLAQANIGIAIGTGSDAALETAEVVLVKGDLMKAAEAIDLSESTLINIKQNLFWAFIYNTIGVPVAALGFLNPGISAAAMAFSSVSVVFNALRLRRKKIQ